MDITVQQVKAAVPIAIVTTHGDLDASNYLSLVAEAQKIYDAGIRYLLLNLSQTPFLSSSGLVALHSIALLMRGEQPLDPEYGWETIHSMDSETNTGKQKHVKLLSPQERVDRTLDRSGLKQYFDIFSDLDTALASFREESPEVPAS